MSAGGTVSSPIYNKGQESGVINLFSFSGDTQMTADHSMRRASPQVFHSNYSPFPHTSTGSSPSDSPLVDLTALPTDTPQPVLSILDQEFEFNYTQQLTGEIPEIHSLQSPTTPPLPDYKPIPPLSPRTILATLDDIANTGPKKKSHARKQPAGHIPRPRNAFILFRCLFVSQQSVPVSVEKDHRNISRIAGRVWKAMSEEDREPWIKAADIEKARHEQRWPGYRYNPVQTYPTQFKRTVSGNNSFNGARVQNPTAGPSRIEINGNERLGRTLVRAQQQGVQRTFKQPELPVQYSSQQTSSNCQFPIHAPLPRIASVPPQLDTVHDTRQLDALSGDSIQFTDPFQITSSAIDNYGNISTPSSTYFEGSLPPDSPVVITAPSANFGRIPPRRSSSCPPLPPPGSSGFAFNSSPIMLQTLSSAQYPSIPMIDSDMDSTGLFRNPFPSNSLFASASLFSGANYSMPHMAVNHTPTSDDRRSVNVLDPLAYPAVGRHIQAHLDTNCRVMHRRGSSLDRALANSTLAGVFGGLSRNSQHWINPWMDASHLNPAIQRSQPTVLPESQLVPNTVTSQYNPAQYPEASLNFLDAETPALSPSPQSSFENVDVYQTPPSQQEESFDIPRELYRRTSTPKTVVAPSQSQSPLGEAFKLSDRKVSGRLFGSQGARLGLELELESPLSLDISFKEGRSLMESHFLNQQHINHSTASSTGSDSPSFPYTPASAHDLSPSVFTYSYTQALLDPEMELSSQEFHLSSDK